jgi:uncharacterized protein (TIGR00661 family)
VSKIFYSMSGEGRGHATRVRTVVEELRSEHQIILLASGAAYDLLITLYDGTRNVRVHKILGLEFQYRNQRLDYPRSIVASLPFVLRLSEHVGRVAGLLRAESPDLAIVDFEPLLPRAAKRLGIPYVSFDHQNFLRVCRLSGLPWRLRGKAQLIRASIGLFCRGQVETIVSSFFAPPLRKSKHRVTQVGVLLRPQILNARPVDDGHLVTYLRRLPCLKLINALRICGRPVRIYGLGFHPPDGNLIYRAIDEQSFVHDLIRCHAVVTNAGNQLVGEALYMRKPVLALPEPGNIEQAINGHFLVQTGGGIVKDYKGFTYADLREFLDFVPALRRRVDTTHIAGNQPAVAAVRRLLGATEESTPIAATTMVA